MLIQPQAECVLDDAGDEYGAFARGQPLLGLAGKLRLHEFGRKHIAAILEYIVGRQTQTAGDQVAEFTEFPQRVEQAGAQAADMGAAEGCRDQVDITFADQRSP